MPTYKDEKTGTWFVKCYYTDYIGNKKQKKKRGFARQKDAKEWEYNFLSSLQYDSTTTFGSIAADFIAENTPRRRKTTIRGITTLLSIYYLHSTMYPVSDHRENACAMAKRITGR